MLQVSRRKARRIIKGYQKGNSLFLEAEAGITRITLWSEKVIRVSYTETGSFPDRQGEELADCQEQFPLEFGAEGDSICLDKVHYYRWWDEPYGAHLFGSYCILIGEDRLVRLVDLKTGTITIYFWIFLHCSLFRDRIIMQA